MAEGISVRDVNIFGFFIADIFYGLSIQKSGLVFLCRI